MLKLILASVLICTLGANEPSTVRTPTPTRSAVPPAPPPPPPPPPMPAATDCWHDFFLNIAACQREFEGTDRIVVSLRRTALAGAGNALNSCLNLVPSNSPVTETPEAPPGSKAYTCLEQLMLDVKECRTKFSPGVTTNQQDPDRDTMKNAFDQCLGGAMSKNGWCNGRKPNNPVQTTRINILEGPALAESKESVTVTVAHSSEKPLNIFWYAAIFNRRSGAMQQQSLGMTSNVPGSPTAITLPIADVGEEKVDVVVLARTTALDDPFGMGAGAYTRVP